MRDLREMERAQRELAAERAALSQRNEVLGQRLERLEERQRALGGGRALKSFQCLRGGGAAPEVAKVHVRGPGGGPELAPLERTLVQLGEDLQGLVHALPYAGVSLTAPAIASARLLGW